MKGRRERERASPVNSNHVYLHGYCNNFGYLDNFNPTDVGFLR